MLRNLAFFWYACIMPRVSLYRVFKIQMKKQTVMTSSEINDFIKSNLDKTYGELSAMTGLSRDSVQKRCRRMGVVARLDPKAAPGIVKALPTKEQVQEDLKKLKQDKTTGDVNKKYEVLLTEMDMVQKRLDAIKSIEPVETFEIKPTVVKGNSEAVAVIVASDWHVGETVNKNTVNGLNSFNEKVAKERAEAFFANSLRLLQVYQKDITINKIVLALLGDFISGNIHEELQEGNSMLPIEELLFAQNLLASGIEYLLNNSDVEILIPCHSGNHGRSTKKQRHATEAGNSFEFYMYHNLANHFRNEKRVKFMIPEGYLSYVDIFNTTVRFHHGHSIQYGGGIGGIFVPAFKAISQWNKSRWATVDVFGHFHQQRNGGNFLCNGSLIGYNAYAVAIKAEFEKPMQTFFLVHNKHGIETVTKIRLE